MKNCKFILLLSVLLASCFLAALPTVSAANCWTYATSSACAADTSCNWRTDSWSSSGWCEEKNCWNFYMQSDCAAADIPGKSCTWTPGSTSYWCEKISCWSYSGTNESACESNALNLSCLWSDYCYSTGGMGPAASSNVNCWDLTTQASCLNATGCSWGQCTEQGCWSYTDSATCTAARDPWNGRNCTWDTTGSYCSENGCWKYWQNESYCTNATGLNCEWKWNSCQERDCWSWDYTNASTCVNNTLNLSCAWNTWGSNTCNRQDCWSYTTSATCQAKPNCLWKAYTTYGWCEEVNCWTWDSWRGGDQADCEGNASAYSLDCIWQNDSAGLGTGWCYKDWTTVSCTNKTTERDCMDTFYCWWQYTDWNTPNLGGTCNEPGSIGGIIINTSISKDWNPGCYIFDVNSTECANLAGCMYSNSKCITNTSYANANEINANGINCTLITDSELCNAIPMLSSCCAWNGTYCNQNKMSTACKDQMEAPPEGATFCEDYNAYENQQLCTQIAGKPWYMPCTWNNATDRCKFNAADVFGNGTQSLVKIDNKKTCESAGGKWVIENYCEGNTSVPVGRCEYKFDEETNCDRACFACEVKDSDGNAINSTNAESACLNSKLGSCEFSANTNAPNGIGYCKVKQQFKKGIAKNCDDGCGDCTYKGDPLSNDTTKRPSYYCTNSKANSADGGCKWIVDNSTATGGYCVNKGEKTCEDACDRCTTQTNCQNLGRTGIANQTGSCIWSGDTNTGSCVPNIGEDMEICWDGIDNTGDGLVDCADASCYSDTWCGFVSGNCFGWTTNATCVENDCEWISDAWGTWCDFKGSQCWKYNQNQSTCNAQTNCQWSSGTGTTTGWCEQDWSRSEACMGLGQAACVAANASGCNWTSDTWCQGTGNGTDWCRDHGGWCEYNDFKPKDCWLYTSGSTECSSHSDCSWHTDQYSIPHCEVNWSANCWQYSDETNCEAVDCYWRSDTWGSWCTNKMDRCWSTSTQATCEAVVEGGVSLCYWETWGGTTSTGYCQPLCYSTSITSSSCSAVPGCTWKQENGWCEDAGMAACTNSTNTNSQANCEGATGCRWKSSGWCDPKNGGFSGGTISGGGGIGCAIGADCYKYDGNQTMCTNRTAINITCGWNANPNPSCEVDWSTNCWQYTSVEGGCNSTTGCWLKNDSYGSYCTNIMDQCWSNTTYQSWSNPDGWLGNCTANVLCTNGSWGCEPACFNSTAKASSAGCTAISGCRWVAGWCNPGSMNQMFDTMEAGAAAPLGIDSCPETGMQASVDICGFGMRDMADAYGFGVGVNNFENASICYKETLSTNVMGMVGGATGFGTSNVGSGNDTVIYLVYLDTDGLTTGGCALSHDSLAVGYEFRFKYTSEWNETTSKAIETFNAYKCDDGTWKATDIKLSAWKKKMCSEIGGPIIAVEKADLARFPTLYNSTEDMRIAVATIGNTGNTSSPTDSAGPAWTTPGSIDFDIENAFGYGADSAKFEGILRQGFVGYENCYNDVNDDPFDDENIDCNDWDCQYADVCEGQGVNAAGYVDTRSPLVSGVTIEEYTDAAMIMYQTNKPTNGTLELYGYGDTRCLNKTDDIYDIGILNPEVRTFKPWHLAQIYNDGDVTANISLDWPLVAGSTYHYKLKVCDSAGKCAISKCSNFTTPTAATCSYCEFVVRLRAPTGWIVSYDVDQDGTYEHVQGQVCGPNAGMKTNYTDGRKANVKLAKSDGTSYFEFINATLTKTGLNDKVRNISTSGDVIGDSAKAGLSADTKDKIINNLHPEACRVKVPKPGTCNVLYHCDDDGNNCIDRTADATLLDAANCVWQVPHCEFSTYKTSSGGAAAAAGVGGSSEAASAPEQPAEAPAEEVYGPPIEPTEKLKVPGFLPGASAAENLTWIVAVIVMGALAIMLVSKYWKSNKSKKYWKQFFFLFVFILEISQLHLYLSPHAPSQLARQQNGRKDPRFQRI